MSISEFHNKISNAILENTASQMETMSKLAQQQESFGARLLEQAQHQRSEGLTMANQWASFFTEMSKENQRQVQQLVNSAVRMSMDTYKSAQQQTIENLTQQVELLSRQVEMLTSAGKN